MMDKDRLHGLLIGRFSWKRMVRSTVIIAVMLVVFSISCADMLIFRPPRAGYGAEDGVVWIAAADGRRIAGMYYERAGAEFTVLFSHGNAEDIGHNREFFERLNRWGYSVLGYDYHGYGLSEGRPTERNAYVAVEAAYAYLLGELGVEPNAVIVLGRSIGSGPAVHLATREPVAGLVLESAVTSAFRVITRRGILPFDKFVNIEKIGDVRCPVLVIHGSEDEIVAPWHGEAMYEAANEPKQFWRVEGAGHNDLLWIAGGEYGRVLDEFVHLILDARR